MSKNKKVFVGAAIKLVMTNILLTPLPKKGS